MTILSKRLFGSFLTLAFCAPLAHAEGWGTVNVTSTEDASLAPTPDLEIL